MSETKKKYVYPADPYSVRVQMTIARKLKEDWMIQLHNDDLTQVDFLNGCLLAYVNGHQYFLRFIRDLKDYLEEERFVAGEKKNLNHSHRKQWKRIRYLRKGEEVKKEYCLDPEDLQDIFDDIDALS